MMGSMAVAPEALRVRLVGNLRVEADGAVLQGAALGSRKARTLLALLAADPERIRGAVEIAEVLWPDGAPESAAMTVASLVSRLRRAISIELITGGRTGYRLGSTGEVDLGTAARLVAEAQRRSGTGEPALAASSARASIDLLRGTVLADLATDASWIRQAREQHEALLRRARQLLATALLQLDDLAAAAAVAREALAADPLDETAVRVLMAAHARAGEPADALRVYADLRARLADELGTDPAAETEALHLTLLRGTVPSADQQPVRSDGATLPGREREVAQLLDCLSSATTGRGALVLITGVAGAGKTRLAHEIASTAATTGALVLESRCYEAERALFLQPLIEAIGAALGRLPPNDILDAAAIHRDSLVRLIPAFTDLLGAPPPGRIRPEVERRRAIEAVAEFFSRLTRRRPVVLLLDDLHNAGTSTVEALHVLRRVLSGSALLVLTTVRSAEGSDVLHALGTAATKLELGALPAAAVRRLAAEAGQDARAEEILRRTGGHALFVTELLRNPAGALPDSLQASVLARVGRLGATTEAILRAGAVLGSTFDPQLAAAIGGIDLPSALQACEGALSDGLLTVAGRHYEFAHDLVREVLYGSTPLPTRTALHERAMDAGALTPEQVAGHAASVGDWLRAARSWLAAGEQALRNFAAADAAALAGRASTAAQRAKDLEQSGRALVLRGRARHAQARNAEAWDDLNAAVAIAREAGDRRLEMMALREVAGDVPVALGHSPASVTSALLRCLHLAEELGAREIEADLLCRLAVLGVTRLDYLAADRHSRRALALCAGSADARVRELALDARKTAVAYLGEVTELAEVVDELEALNRRSGDLYRLQWTLVESAFVPLFAGDYPAAVTRIEAALATCRRSGYTAIEPYHLAQLAWVHRLAGEHAAALDVGADAVALAQRHSHAWWLATAAAVHGMTLVEAGRQDEAAALLSAVVPAIDVPGGDAYLARCLGPLAAATGDTAITAHAERLLRGISTPPGSAWLAGADTYLATACALTDAGHPNRAAALLAPLVAAARRVGWTDLLRRAEPAAT